MHWLFALPFSIGFLRWLFINFRLWPYSLSLHWLALLICFMFWPYSLALWIGLMIWLFALASRMTFTNWHYALALFTGFFNWLYASAIHWFLVWALRIAFFIHSLICLMQGILKAEVLLYHWPPVWLVCNQLYGNWQFLFYLQNRPIWTSQTGGQWYSDTSPFSIPCLMHWLHDLSHVECNWKKLIRRIKSCSIKFCEWCQKDDTQHNDTQHYSKNITLGIMTLSIKAVYTN